MGSIGKVANDRVLEGKTVVWKRPKVCLLSIRTVYAIRD